MISARLIFLATLWVLTFYSLAAQPEPGDGKQEEPGIMFFFDAICFKGNTDSLARVDIYVVVPYQSLDFSKSKEIHAASYQLVLKATDEQGNLIKAETVNKNIYEKDYFSSQGGTGKFDFTQTIMSLPPGKTDIEAVITDNFSKQSSHHARTVTILNFGKYPISLSGIVLVSSIEESGSRNSVTPHISDNVGDLQEGFFAFFELYNSRDSDSLDFAYEIVNTKDERVFCSPKMRKATPVGTSQHYLRCKFPKAQAPGVYTIRIIAMNKSDRDSIVKSDYAAVTERLIKYYRTFGGILLNDIDKMIKQIRYVASNDDLDYIEAAVNEEEKQARFERFWEKLDPSPNTERNEAFDQYYSRIENANKLYRSYNEGWRTDMGMVYIIYGEPLNKERPQTSYSDGRIFERWTYPNSRQFIFVDNSGFGDFRLYSPYSVTDKYKYQAP